jgi:hypothetical protein
VLESFRNVINWSISSDINSCIPHTITFCQGGVKGENSYKEDNSEALEGGFLLSSHDGPGVVAEAERLSGRARGYLLVG